MSQEQALLEADFSADYRNRTGVLRDINFRVMPGEIMGLIGQSGCGKSSVAMSILRLLELRGGRVRGSIRFGGRDLIACSEHELRSIRGREIALVLQSPISALNPALRIETQLREVWRAHRAEPWSQGRPQVRAVMATMGLPEEEDFLRRYPSQLSIGQAQRVVIAMAVMHRPRLLIADEPTSALDAVSAREILDLFRRLNREQGMAILYISHDLASVADLCHTVTVLREGRVAEHGKVADLLQRPDELVLRGQ